MFVHSVPLALTVFVVRRTPDAHWAAAQADFLVPPRAAAPMGITVKRATAAQRPRAQEGREPFKHAPTGNAPLGKFASKVPFVVGLRRVQTARIQWIFATINSDAQTHSNASVAVAVCPSCPGAQVGNGRPNSATQGSAIVQTV